MQRFQWKQRFKEMHLSAVICITYCNARNKIQALFPSCHVVIFQWFLLDFSGAWHKTAQKGSAIKTTHSCEWYCLKCRVVKPKLKQRNSVPPSPCEKPNISSIGLNPTGDGGEEVLDCDAEGTETSVSHELCGAALAFTDCVIFLQAFILSTVSYFLPRSGIGGSRNLSHAQNTYKP